LLGFLFAVTGRCRSYLLEVDEIAFSEIGVSAEFWALMTDWDLIPIATRDPW
jgi:hypothetical protein